MLLQGHSPSETNGSDGQDCCSNWEILRNGLWVLGTANIVVDIVIDALNYYPLVGEERV